MELFRDVADAMQFGAEKMRKNSLFATERVFCDVYAFESGQTQSAHRHTDSDKVYFVLRGAGVFRVNGEERRLSEGAAVFCPAGSDHSVTNPGAERLALIVFMAPPPTAR